MRSLPRHLAHILKQAQVLAIPECTEAVKCQADKNVAWDYSSPSAMQIFNKSKKTGAFGFENCQKLAEAISMKLGDVEHNDAIEKLELKQIGNGAPEQSGFFLNVFLKN